MTPFVSIALFRREGRQMFKPPRKEPFDNQTQARKAAARFWRGNIQEPDKLNKVVIVHAKGSTVCVAERPANASRDRKWVEFTMQTADAFEQPHLAACLAEIGVDPDRAPPALPETLEINGVIYRREI